MTQSSSRNPDLAARAAFLVLGVAGGIIALLLIQRLAITPTQLGAYGSITQGVGAILAVGTAAWLISVTQRQVAASQEQVVATLKGQQQANEQLAIQLRKQSEFEAARVTQQFLFEAMSAVASAYYIARTFFLNAKRFLTQMPTYIPAPQHLQDQLHAQVTAPLQESVNELEARMDRADALLAVLETRASTAGAEQEERNHVELRNKLRSVKDVKDRLLAFLSDATNVRGIAPADFDRLQPVVELREAVSAFQLAAVDLLVAAYADR